MAPLAMVAPHFSPDRAKQALPSTERVKLTPRGRSLAIAAGTSLALILALAMWLRPNASGFSTHEQLGLPVCTFRWLFGMRCPSCGMTTAWAHVVRGELPGALRANVGGTALALAAIVAVPCLFVSAKLGRWWPARPGDVAVAWAIGAVVAITLLDWATRLLRM